MELRQVEAFVAVAGEPKFTRPVAHLQARALLTGPAQLSARNPEKRVEIQSTRTSRPLVKNLPWLGPMADLSHQLGNAAANGVEEFEGHGVRLHI
jgi:hypothetical protein